MRRNLAAFASSVLLALAIVPSALAASEGEGTLPLTVRDFQQDGVLFDGGISSSSGMVGEYLGADKKPVYNLEVWQTMYGGDVSQANLDSLFTDVPGVNMSTWKFLGMTPTGDGYWVLNSDDNGDGFFPIDGELFGNTEGQDHNFHFSVEIHTKFTYQEGATFEFAGDDDVWVYFNGRLVIDLGGVHSSQSASVQMDDIAAELGIAPGDLVDFDMFYMERHTTQSNLYIRTNFDFLSIEELSEYYDIPDMTSQGEVDLCGVWEGYYIDSSNGVDTLRNIRMQVTDCSDGAFSGTIAYTTPSDDSTTGEYRFEGSLEGGNVSFKGTEWVVYNENFDFALFTGQVCGCGDIMYGINSGITTSPLFLARAKDDGAAMVAPESQASGTAPLNSFVSGVTQMVANPAPADVPQETPETPAVYKTGDPLSYDVVWSNYNIAKVYNGPSYIPVVTVGENVWVSSIKTYHWNEGMGDVLPGAIYVEEVTGGWDNAIPVGEWQGQFDQTGLYVYIVPDIVFEAGRSYAIHDSRPETWSTNDGSDFAGFVEVRGAAL